MVLTAFVLWAGAVPTRAEGDRPPSTVEGVTFPQVLALPVEVSPIAAAYGPHRLQTGELWLPAADAATVPAPLVVMIHGGCWSNAFAVDHTRPAAAALAQAGFAVWALEYRRTGDEGGGWPGSLEDIRLALDNLDRLSTHPVDLRRVALVGHSAGGHLALLAAQDRPQVGLVVGLAAITDLVAYGQGDNSCQRAVPRFMGGSPAERPQDYRDADPAARPLRSTTVLLHGDADAIVPLTQARLAGAEVLVVPGAGHFDWLHPDSRAFAALTQLLRTHLSPALAGR